MRLVAIAVFMALLLLLQSSSGHEFVYQGRHVYFGPDAYARPQFLVRNRYGDQDQLYQQFEDNNLKVFELVPSPVTK